MAACLRVRTDDDTQGGRNRVAGDLGLLDPIREFPFEERSEIHCSQLGWALKKHANRIVRGLEFQKLEADERTARRVVAVNPPPLAASPPFTPRAQETATPPVEAEVEVEI